MIKLILPERLQRNDCVASIITRGCNTGLAKKEPYFTLNNLEHQALEMVQQVQEISQAKNVSYHPQESALLVLDMQEYFLLPASHAFIPSAPAIIEGILQLVDAYTVSGRPVIFTQHINNEYDAGRMSTWWKDTITDQNPYRGIIPEIDTSKGHLVRKSQYDAFYETRLEELLREAGVTQVVICGVMTHLCCETTARSAFMRGFTVFFPVDGTATYNLDFHRASLINLAHGFATLTLVRDIKEKIQGNHER